MSSYILTKEAIEHIVKEYSFDGKYEGDKIFVDTIHNILTPNSATIARVTMKGKFSMHSN